MKNWQKYRQVLLATSFFSVSLTIISLLVIPAAGNRQVRHYEFPEKVPFPGWVEVENFPLDEPIDRDKKAYEAVLAGRKYQYQQDERKLQIEMRYVVGTLGSDRTYLKLHPELAVKMRKLPFKQQKKTTIGHYLLFEYDDRAHLLSCINPRGSSTVQIQQFMANRRTYDLKIERLLPWLLGQESLRDRRCLWTHLSTPLNSESAESSYRMLETAYLSWYEYWRQHFPKH
ncbi:cyanoexosortase A system-associated protein [Oscillatoria salina]|uniref:cyanoexosortase A system-associated protein n=1 Tax=Oscillatoria salina TaxID=331517 RepID=UPI0013BABACA|nr:cyanoexosortase A system-associated protein [Oscillatoria salina]MBZ8180044.1 cyanoexosortase A system-associated protein [Oscillatoria salina IIICB1]NET88906.1 cyanoexosortase A system-associated protein [Kamptonema sp. SIO1D9]